MVLQRRTERKAPHMKKASAILISVLFYISAFMLIIFFAFGRNLSWFFFGLPAMAAVYFVIAGNIFSRRLNLDRWILWVCMNFIGGLLSWIILLVCFPILLFNGFIIFLFLPVTGVFAAVWICVGAGYLCVRRLGRRS